MTRDEVHRRLARSGEAAGGGDGAGAAVRERLPDRRGGWTQRVKIGQQTFYLRTGEYADGRLGEIFLVTHKEGAFTRGILDTLAMMTSIALQHGTPVEAVVQILRGSNFPPSGFVIADGGTSAVKKCSSVPDWIAQELAAAYLPKPEGDEPPPNGLAVVAPAVVET